MNHTYAKPGDTIMIIINNGFFGRKFIVKECPENKKDSESEDTTWIEIAGEMWPLTDPTHYKIVKTATFRIVDDMDRFLKEQMDDNLRSVFS